MADSRRNTFHTSDFWLSAALIAVGRKLLRLDWHDRRATFVFEDALLCSENAEAYWRRDLFIVAKDFTLALRDLKDRLHGDEKWKREQSGKGA